MKLSLAALQNWQHSHKQADEVRRIQLGDQDLMDLLSYQGLEEHPDYIVLDGIYRRCLFISGYPLIANTNWLHNLINFNHNIDISFHVESINDSIALPKLRRKVTELESTKRALIKAGKIVGPEVSDPLLSATQLRDRIQRGQEKLFQLSIYISLAEASLEKLNAVTSSLESGLASHLFYIKTARYQQLEALDATLPRGTDILAQKRNLDTTSTALTFPFLSSELVHEIGILYGINKVNNSLVIIDRFSLNNANSIIFAQSGSGKSYFAKVEILRQLMQGSHVVVIDPEREYSQLAHSLKGSVIRMSATSKDVINPFDLHINQYEDDQIAEHIQNLTEIISLLAEGLDTAETPIIDKVLTTLYRSHKKKTSPLLADFVSLLKKKGHSSIANRLEKFTTGSLSEVFNRQTNISLTNRLVVFDIKDLPESLRKIMIMIIAHYVENRVKSHPQKRILVIDEAWLLLEHEESARFISGLVRRARKYFLGVSIITQQANDFLSNHHGRAIASQSSLRILMHQDTTTIDQVQKQFHLSDYEKQFLLTCDRGEAIAIADQTHISFQVVASRDEHPLLTTDPREVFLSQEHL